MGIFVLLLLAQSTCFDVPVKVKIFGGYLGIFGGIFFLLRSAQSMCFTVQVNFGILGIPKEYLFFLRPAQPTCFTAQVIVGIIFQEYFKNPFFSSVLHSLLCLQQTFVNIVLKSSSHNGFQKHFE